MGDTGQKQKKTLLIITLVSIVLCGCPACFLIIPGLRALTDAIDRVYSYATFLPEIGHGFLEGGWMLCLGSFMLIVPATLLIVQLFKPKKKPEIEKLEPKGISSEDEIPPAS